MSVYVSLYMCMFLIHGRYVTYEYCANGENVQATQKVHT